MKDQGAARAIHEAARDERMARLRPEPIRVEAQEKWWLPAYHENKWEEM